MNGTEVCSRAREIKPDVVRMIVTAYADVHTAVDAINRGQISRYIPKPYKKQDLLDILRNAIDFVTIQRGVREMEMRLLRGSPQATAQAVQAELADALAQMGAELRGSIEQASDLVRAALIVAQGGAAPAGPDDRARLVELLDGARRSHADAATTLAKLQKLGSRLRTGQPLHPPPVRCDAARAVDSMVRILRVELERHGDVEVQIQGVPEVPIEASALGQVVMSLLLNAAQAAVPGSRGTHRMVVRLAVEGDEALISVSDNGVGIAPEARGRIFDPYFSTRPDGAGLGLAVARELVAAAGGSIEVASAPNLGSTFTVRLPRVTS
jgi:signal transduction histidine kinase